MREYGQIQSAFWHSKDCEVLTDAGRLLACYLMAGPHTNGIGCFRLSDGPVMDDLGWDAEKVSERFRELFEIGFAYRQNKVVFLPSFLRWNKIMNGNIAKARFGDWEALSKGNFKVFAARAMLEFCDLWHGDHRPVLETVAQTVTQTLSELFRNPDLQVENQNPTPPQPTLSTPQHNQTSLVRKVTKSRTRQVASDDFEQFWSLYPRRDGKAAALKSWVKINPDNSLFGLIINAVKLQASSPKWKAEPQFIPMPATWLNGARWEDQAQSLFIPTGTSKNMQKIQTLQGMIDELDTENDSERLSTVATARLEWGPG